MTQRRCILCSLVTFLILSHWRPSSADEGAANSQTTGVLNHLFLHKRLFITDHNLLPHGRRFVPYSGNRGKKATPARRGKSSYITWFNSLRISFAWSLPHIIIIVSSFISWNANLFSFCIIRVRYCELVDSACICM